MAVIDWKFILARCPTSPFLRKEKTDEYGTDVLKQLNHLGALTGHRFQSKLVRDGDGR